jgi:hypothetical protein
VVPLIKQPEFKQLTLCQLRETVEQKDFPKFQELLISLPQPYRDDMRPILEVWIAQEENLDAIPVVLKLLGDYHQFSALDKEERNIIENCVQKVLLSEKMTLNHVVKLFRALVHVKYHRFRKDASLTSIQRVLDMISERQEPLPVDEYMEILVALANYDLKWAAMDERFRQKCFSDYQLIRPTIDYYASLKLNIAFSRFLVSNNGLDEAKLKEIVDDLQSWKQKEQFEKRCEEISVKIDQFLKSGKKDAEFLARFNDR